MAFKFLALCSLLAITNAGVITPITTYAVPHHNIAIANPAVDAIASTHQNVVRSFGGTVSTYSKAIDTPYSSVRKQDTRITNNIYTPVVAKTISYAVPAVTKTIVAPVQNAVVYKHNAPVYAQATAPVVYSHATPSVVKSISYAVPTVTKTILAPAPAVYTHAVPTVARTVSYNAPVATISYNHGPAATTYTHEAPGVSGYGSSQTIHYSPAELVSHMSFDGFGTHWGF